MEKIPFLLPDLVKYNQLKKYFKRIDQSKIYSNYGPLNTLFEKKVMENYFDDKGAVTTVSNATIGLITSINQVKRHKGKYALMPSFTFPATPLAAIWCGLEPLFVDIREDDWCMDEKLIRKLIDELGDKISVIIPYATFGTNLDLSFYTELCELGIPVVVDAAPCFGSSDLGKSFGQSFPGLIVYSFHATKSFGVGEGGLVYSKDEKVIAELRKTGNFGFNSYRETDVLGINSKISEFTAAIALATLEDYPEKINRRKQIYQWYCKAFQHHDSKDEKWIIQKSCGEIAHQFFPILCPKGEINKNFIELLSKNNVEARTYFSPPCHQQKFFKNYPTTTLDVTNDISTRIISLPLWEGMNNNHVEKIVKILFERCEN